MSTKVKKQLEFECVKCGSKKLVLERYIRCQIPVMPGDKGILEYLPSVYHEDDQFVIGCSYACENGHEVMDDEGQEIETEQRMIWHLQQSIRRRKEMYENLIRLMPHKGHHEQEEQDYTPTPVPNKGTATFNHEELHPFECRECNSGELAYQKYVKCITPVVVHHDGTLEYLQSEFDEDDYIPDGYGYSCGNGHMITSYGHELQCEGDIIGHLQMTQKEREDEWQDNMKKEEARAEAHYECEEDSSHDYDEQEEIADYDEDETGTEQEEEAQASS